MNQKMFNILNVNKEQKERNRYYVDRKCFYNNFLEKLKPLQLLTFELQQNQFRN